MPIMNTSIEVLGQIRETRFVPRKIIFLNVINRMIFSRIEIFIMTWL